MAKKPLDPVPDRTPLERMEAELATIVPKRILVITHTGLVVRWLHDWSPFVGACVDTGDGLELVRAIAEPGIIAEIAVRMWDDCLAEMKGQERRKRGGRQ